MAMQSLLTVTAFVSTVTTQAEAASQQCSATAFDYCCLTSTCRCHEPASAAGQCYGNTYRYCCNTGTPCICADASKDNCSADASEDECRIRDAPPVSSGRGVKEWFEMGKDELLASWYANQADVNWVKERMSRLHAVGQITTHEISKVSSVSPSNWPAVQEATLKKVTPSGAQQRVRDEVNATLSRVPYLEIGAERIFDLNLNFEAGGSQYMSCIKFMVKKTGKYIVFGYSMFGKQWKEQATYKLDANFWENIDIKEKVKNFLSAHADRNLAMTLAGPEGKTVINHRLS